MAAERLHHAHTVDPSKHNRHEADFHDFLLLMISLTKIHTLCCAAYNVIQVLNKKQNSPLTLNDMMLKDVSDLLSTKAQRKEAHHYLNETENFLKHGNSDPQATHTFNSDYTEALSFDAVIS
jgi:hypothetical protein